jgi:hypothetical protein
VGVLFGRTLAPGRIGPQVFCCRSRSDTIMEIGIPGESRDPPINNSVRGTVDPGVRRECDLNG